MGNSINGPDYVKFEVPKEKVAELTQLAKICGCRYADVIAEIDTETDLVLVHGTPDQFYTFGMKSKILKLENYSVPYNGPELSPPKLQVHQKKKTATKKTVAEIYTLPDKFVVHQFSPVHFRINNTVDVWPTTGRYYVLTSKVKGRFESGGLKRVLENIL